MLHGRSETELSLNNFSKMKFMKNSVWNNSKIILVVSIVLPFIFFPFILLDYLEIETPLIGKIRVAFMFCYLIQILLPIVIIILYRRSNENRKQLLYAAIISIATILMLIITVLYL
jgi:hypothetical protein